TDSTSRSPNVILDLTRLPEPSDTGSGPVGALARFVRRIQLMRGDYNGRMLTLRQQDLEAVAHATGTDPDDLADELRQQAILARS
ncbi:MAG: hypothetical protein R3343_13780, partial [Nitriliruptorales bacterium]|nr:hypothetical protein [Nitriliruptorales bacterium]